MSKILTAFACVAFIVMAFINPPAFIENARNGLTLFAVNVLPILFPFFFITGLLVELDLFKHKKLQPIGIVAMSFLAGSPTSARIISQLYMRGDITRERAIRTATYTSTTSPIFIIATLGAALYGDIRLGIIIFTAHILGAIANGLVYGLIVKTPTEKPPPSSIKNSPSLRTPLRENLAPLRSVEGVARQSRDGVVINVSDAVSKSLSSSIQNIFAVGGLIVIFFIVSASLPLPFTAFLEMTTGVFRAEAVTEGMWRAVVATAIVSFGGLCVAMQSFVFFRTFRMPVRFYFMYKVTHTLFAVLFVTLIMLMVG